MPRRIRKDLRLKNLRSHAKFITMTKKLYIDNSKLGKHMYVKLVAMPTVSSFLNSKTTFQIIDHSLLTILECKSLIQSSIPSIERVIANLKLFILPF